MAKIFELLRRSLPPTEGRIMPAPKLVKQEAEIVSAEVPPVVDDEIPYIEVGPNRELTGSASVLRFRPVTQAAKPIVSSAPATPVISVAFRSLPIRKNLVEATPKMAAEVIAFHDPDHAVSEQYRALLRSTIDAVPPGKPALLLAAALPGMAITNVLLNLAVTAARTGKRVVVVDGIGAASTFTESLGIVGATGLNDVLAGTTPLDRALQKTAQDALLALPAGVGGSFRATPAAARVLLGNLRERCDLVFFMSQRWDGRPEHTALAAVCDGVFLVIPAAEAESTQVNELLQIIPEQGGRLAGYILAG